MQGDIMQISSKYNADMKDRMAMKLYRFRKTVKYVQAKLPKYQNSQGKSVLEL
jgi:hypothetical protein